MSERLSPSVRDHNRHPNPPANENAKPSDQPQAGSASPSDAASSLRAAALLTLKSKRRKPATMDLPSALTLAKRPIPSSSLVLNYGEEESTSTPLTTAPPSVISRPIATRTVISDAEDNREEGEISDTESTPPPAPLAPKTSPKKTLRNKASMGDKDGTKPAPTTPTSARPPFTMHSDTPVAGPSTSVTSTSSRIPHYSTLQPGSYVVDADHVRPGLSMNEHQYNASKDTILDLLGWGVEPEYLIDVGLSREIIFYVFTELRLRLPRNLNTTGLAPFYPPFTEPASIPSPAPMPATATLASVRSQRSNSIASAAAMPPPPPPSFHPHSEATIFAPGRVSHPSLPQRPHAPQGNHSGPPSRSSTGPPTQLSVLTDVRDIQLARQESLSAIADADLHEMEQLRKQELIARKAVIASRKNKSATANTSTGSPSALSELKEKEVGSHTVIPAASVDDFLKSIESPGGATPISNDAVPAHFRRHSSPEAMDVDDIPGLSSGRGEPSMSRSPTGDELSSRMSAGSGLITPTESSEPSLVAGVSGSQLGDPYLSKGPTPPSDDEPQQGDATHRDINPVRRGTKRPVASDFVDFEAGISRPQSTNGYSNGGTQPPSMRRKTGSFASVSGMRRCVIDVSDSEDDDEGVENEHGQRIFSPLPTRAQTTPSTLNGSGWPLSQHHLSNGNSGHQSPAALFEKEEEIKKMKEMIMQREQNRLKKAVASSRATPNIVTDAPRPSRVTPPSTVPKLKQEQDHSPINLPSAPANGDAQERSNGHDHNTPVPEVVPDAPLRKGSGSIVSISELPTPIDANGVYSSSAPPTIDDDLGSNTMENITTGEQVLTAEAEQESVEPSSASRVDSPTGEPVDVYDLPSSSSTQGPQIYNQDQSPTSATDNYPPYNSPFVSYPLLRSHLRRMLPDDASMTHSHQQKRLQVISSHDSASLSSTSSILASSSFPDLKPLKRAVSFKALDPSKRICQYELPGGGVCRDDGCEDVHLSRGLDGVGVDGIEPSDEDTAEYLFDVLSSKEDRSSWLAQGRRVTVVAIQDALRGLRGAKVYEERVAEALATLS